MYRDVFVCSAWQAAYISGTTSDADAGVLMLSVYKAFVSSFTRPFVTACLCAMAGKLWRMVPQNWPYIHSPLPLVPANTSLIGAMCAAKAGSGMEKRG